MVNNKIWGNILQTPLLILSIATVPVAIYAAYKDMISSYAPSVILALLVISYFAGVVLKRRKDSDMWRV